MAHHSITGTTIWRLPRSAPATSPACLAIPIPLLIHGSCDGSYHIPLIIRDPSQPAQSGHVVEHFTDSVDIMPTVLDQLGMPLPVQLDGQSLLPFLKAETTRSWRSSAHWEYDFRNIQNPRAEKQLELASQQCNLAVIRDASFKYVHFAGLPPLLFDLTKHPDESVNCVNEAAYRDQRLSYAEALLCWRAEHLDQSLAMSMLTANGWSQGQPRTALR